MTQAYEVPDGHRILSFDGDEIGFSTSERPGADRWIEFTLYKTAGDGQYILARVGVSNVYHTPECRVAVNGNIPPVPWADLDEGMTPCRECRPSQGDFPLVCPELDKTWARSYKSADTLFRGLMKNDKNDGSLYMTAVARRLVEDAAQRDPVLGNFSRVETVT